MVLRRQSLLWAFLSYHVRNERGGVVGVDRCHVKLITCCVTDSAATTEPPYPPFN
jgi:hypothetical protein